MNNVGMLTLIVLMILFLGLLIVLSIYTIWRSSLEQKMQFDVKMEIAKSSGNTTIKSMSYKDLQEIVNQLINFHVNSVVSTSNIRDKSTDELSIILDTMIVDVCARVKISLSNDILNAFYMYITDDFLNSYIKNLSRALLLAKIDNVRKK